MCIRDSEATSEYLKRLSVIWSSNISIPRKVLATKTFVVTTLQYHMWTTDWTVIQLKDIDRRTREILRKEGGMHHHESIKLLYLPEELVGSGIKSIEDTYKLTAIKMANYLNNSIEKRIKYARTLEMIRIAQGRKSIFNKATKYAAEYNIICNFDNTGTTISASKDPTAAIETMTITTPSPTALKELLRSKITEKYTKDCLLYTSPSPRDA